MRKKIRQKYGLFMQNKCLHRISFFYEKRIRHSCRLNSSSKTFLNQWESMGFIKPCCAIECFHGECRVIFNNKTIKNKLFCWVLPKGRPYKEWHMQSLSSIYLLCTGITIIVNISTLKHIKNCAHEKDNHYDVSLSERQQILLLE